MSLDPQHASTPRGARRPLWRHSLLLKYTAFVAVAIILTGGVLAHLGFIFARDMLHDEIHNRLRLVASERSAAVEAYAARQLERVALVSSRTHLRELVRQYAEGNSDAATFTDATRRILRDAQAGSADFLALWITGPSGSVITTTEPTQLPASFADEPVFLAGRKQPYLDIPRHVEGRKGVVVYAAMPLEGEGGRLVGVLIGLIDATPLDALLADEAGLAQTGEVVVGTRRDGQIEYLLPRRGKPRVVPVEQAEPMAAALDGQSGAQLATYEGVPVLAAYQPVAYQPGGGRRWGLVAKMDLVEAYAPTYRLRRILLGLQALLVVVGAGLAFFLARRFTRPVMRLADSAAAVAAGRLDVRVPAERRDELGALGAAFNYMAGQLSDARDRLEQRVRERTRELSQSQKELSRQTHILQSVLDSMGDGVIVADQQGRFVLWNPAAAQIIGIGPRDAAPDRWSAIYGCYLSDGETPCPPDQLPLARAIRGEWVDGAELFIQNADVPEGVWINVNARPLRNERGELRGGVIVVRDVTAERRARRELTARDTLNRAILATAHEAFVAIDPDSVIRQWNEQAEATFGWTRDEAVGRSLPETIIPERFREAHRQGVARYLATGEGPLLNRRVELIAAHRDGHEFPIEITITSVQQGETHLFCAFVHDVTEQKQAQRELERAKETAVAASEAKSRFLANMSHEIRTPMNAVIGMTELVLDTDLTPTQREYLTMVQESADALLLTINDILDFSKIEAGHLELENEAFDLREMLGDTMKPLALRAHRKDLELAYHVAPEVPEMVIGDRHRLRQIVVNLVGNAIKFTERGEVVLDAALESRANGQARLHFFVRDTGVGIAENARRRIFEAFEQADESSTRRFSGTGLGLAISARLVELMGGKIWVESEFGRGSIFHFTVPFGVSDQPRPPEERPPQKMLEGLRVLIVDDNATNCFILEEIMRNWRMRVRCANSGQTALDALHQGKQRGEHCDLVLVDAHMPGIDGMALIEEIQKDPQLRSTVAIMLTSNDRPEDLVLSEQLGIRAYLIKPIKQSELFNAIAQALGVKTVQAAKPPSAAEVQLRPLKILLAEDSVVNQKLAVALLEPRGHTLIVADNGREAVRRVEEDHFDLVLMDVQMPEMDGLEATREIRRREEQTGRHVPIIAMTAHAMKGDRERCLEAGMDAYVSKPVRAADLFATITGEIPDAMRLKGVAPEEAETGAAVEGDGANRKEEPAEPETEGETAMNTEPNGAAEGVFDWDAALEKTKVGADTLRELTEVFLRESPQLLEEIHAALEAGDAPRVRRCAHTIKGSAAVFAAEPTTTAAARLEDLGKRNELDQAPAALEELERQYHRLAPALQARARSENSQEAQE